MTRAEVTGAVVVEGRSDWFPCSVMFFVVFMHFATYIPHPKPPFSQ